MTRDAPRDFNAGRREIGDDRLRSPYGNAIQRLALRLFLGRVANRLGG
ncbi:hypothetical protein [Burkholderia ubonensis]|nr:hypothetical protein [Burkholderia ubonensis]